MSSIKVKLTDGSRGIELEGEFADVQQVLGLWWSQNAVAAGGSDPGEPTGVGTDAGTSAGKADHIAVDTGWSGTVTVDRTTTVDPGVTLTIAAGTVVTIKNPASLIIAGIVEIQGTSAAKVTFTAPTPGEGHGGLAVLGGGELRMLYGVLSGGGLSIGLAGKATILDSTLTNPRAAGDVLAMNGGTLDMQHSEISLTTGDGGHTALLFNGASNAINVTHCTIRGAPYGLMFYGGTNAVFTNNNWDNGINVDATSGVSGDFSGSYFRGGAPMSVAGATLKVSNAMMAPLVDAKPRP
jgi:hypothetical protein